MNGQLNIPEPIIQSILNRLECKKNEATEQKTSQQNTENTLLQKEVVCSMLSKLKTRSSQQNNILLQKEIKSMGQKPVKKIKEKSGWCIVSESKLNEIRNETFRLEIENEENKLKLDLERMKSYRNCPNVQQALIQKKLQRMFDWVVWSNDKLDLDLKLSSHPGYIPKEQQTIGFDPIEIELQNEIGKFIQNMGDLHVMNQGGTDFPRR